MLCEEEKKTLEGRTGISLEVLIWLLMGPGGHSSIPRGTKLEVWPHRHPVIASSPLPQQSPLQYLPSELLVWKRQQNHPYTSLFSLFLIYIKKGMSAMLICFCSWHPYPCRNYIWCWGQSSTGCFHTGNTRAQAMPKLHFVHGFSTSRTTHMQ